MYAVKTVDKSRVKQLLFISMKMIRNKIPTANDVDFKNLYSWIDSKIISKTKGYLTFENRQIDRLQVVFTATCFSNVAVMGSLDVRLSVCLSVCL